MKEDQDGSNPGLSHVALAGPDPEPMHDDFVATIYPQMKHLDINSLTTNQRKNLEKQMWKQNSNPWSRPFYQSKLKCSPCPTFFSSHFILSPPKPASTPAPEPIFTATTTTTTTTLLLPLPPIPPTQSSTYADLNARILALEKKYAEFEQKNRILENTTKNLRSMIFELELRDLLYTINQTVHEVVKEAVQTALQASLLDRFRDLSEADMKEILHQRMFESGSYKSHPEHVALYEAHPPQAPPKDSDPNKKSRRESDASGSKQPPAPQSSAWKTFDTREAPSSSSKQKLVPQTEQPIEDVPLPDDVNIYDSKDTDTAHLPKNQDKADWFKPIPEDDMPASPEPDWIIPPNDFPKAENNWTDALAKSYKDQEENKLLSKTGDIGSFIKCAAYGITHSWFKQKEFYIQRHIAPSDRRAVRSHMRILNVTSPKTYKRYGYTYLREIVLRRADYNEYKISKSNFKNLYPDDFEDLYFLHLQGKLNHLPRFDKVHLFNAVNLWIRNLVIKQRVADLQLGIESYQTKLNLTQSSWDALDFLFK
ncbi:hypothetical protein Tco_1345070 [Tanacetum coccineum]